MKDYFQPDPRFEEYTQIVKGSQIVGFKLDGSDFEFLFDKWGGWYDQKGHYYDKNAIPCSPPLSESSSDSENEGGEGKILETNIEKMSLNDPIEEDDKIQVIKDLQKIVDSYPEGEPISFTISLEPFFQNDDWIISNFLKQKLKVEDLSVFEGNLQLKSHQTAKILCQLEASQVPIGQHQDNSRGNNQQASTLYVDLCLYKAWVSYVNMGKKALLKELNQLGLEKGVDFANVEEIEKGKCCFDLREELIEDMREKLQGFQLQE